MNKHILELSYKFNCLCCGTCCKRYQPRLEKSEVFSISKHLGLNEKEFLDRFTDPRWPGDSSFLIIHNQSGCIFLTESGDGKQRLCSIHEIKPDCCKQWQSGLDKPECRAGLSELWDLTVDDNGNITGTLENIERYKSSFYIKE